ncbi:ankyrin repeat domain-containing protein [Flavobacterium sp. '19STA2R22 D10 B1']|uniref:ankyrin repeat domain-containing protein n=1 Tax=Flavobacterium aerium TaxID=3037261 RepID=UPI00278C4F46|nr:ankyrin repeat domain-containing protein [Flavobacterium sp. '19STA2R22 D10 B1']
MSDSATLLGAFRNNNFEEGRLILKENKNLLKSMDDYNRSQIFEKAIREQSRETLQFFIAEGIIETDIYEYDGFKGSIFESIVRNQQFDESFIAFLDDFFSKLDSLNDEVMGHTLLSYAIEEGADIEVVKSLVKAGCDVNYTNNSDDTFLHRIASNNRMRPEKALAYLEFFIQEGLDINAENVVNKTALSYSLSRQKEAQMDLLLQQGADPNHQDDKGKSSFYEVVVDYLDIKLYDKLKEYQSPDLNQVNSEQTTILFEYARRIHDSSESTIKLLVKLIEDGGDLLLPSIYYGNGKTPIEAIAEKSFDVFKAVIDLDVIDINHIDKDGNNLLHIVCAFNVNYDNEQARDTYKKAKLLIEKGIDSNLINSKEQTALMLASDDNLKLKTVELLLKNKS